MKVCLFIIAFTSCLLFNSCKKDELEFHGRLSEVWYVNSQWKMEMKYGPDDKLVSTMPYVEDTLIYDNQGRLIKYFDGYVTYAFEHSANGQISRRVPVSTVSVNYHPDTIRYHYDALGRVVQAVSTFVDQGNISRQGWIRDYSYNEENDIIHYKAIHSFYNQAEDETLSYDNSENPLQIANSILFFLNEHLYVALNQHNPKRKDNEDYIATYDYIGGKKPVLQTIKHYSPGQPVSPSNYNSSHSVRFTYE